MLVAERLVGGYGGADILKGVSVKLDAGEIVVIVGPNGAGKSTVMKAVFGLVALREGSISFAGEEISKLPTEQRVKLIFESGATVLCATPTYVLRLAQSAREMGLDPRASKVRRIILSGEPFDAQEAWRIGLVNKLVPADRLLAEAEQLLRGILSMGPLAVRLALEALLREGVAAEVEGYRWSALAVGGSVLALAGLLIALSGRQARG